MLCLWIDSENCNLKMDILFKMHSVAWQNVGMWTKFLFTVQAVSFSTEKGNFCVFHACKTWLVSAGGLHVEKIKICA